MHYSYILLSLHTVCQLLSAALQLSTPSRTHSIEGEKATQHIWGHIHVHGRTTGQLSHIVGTSNYTENDTGVLSGGADGHQIRERFERQTSLRVLLGRNLPLGILRVITHTLG